MSRGVVTAGLLLLGFAAFSDAVSNCWMCDANQNNCNDKTNWAIVACNATGGGSKGGIDLPCFKHSITGNRGCATAAACAVSGGVRDYDFDWSWPISWLWFNLIQPTFHDCYSQTHGCHQFYCCRDKDRCNSSPQLVASTLSVIAVGLSALVFVR